MLSLNILCVTCNNLKGEEEGLKMGCEIFENLINNVANYSQNLSYFQYKKMALSFIQLGLTFILDPTTNIMKRLALNMLQNQLAQNLTIFNKLANLLLLCLSFSFNLSYIFFENEWELKETFIINVINYKIYNIFFLFFKVP